MPPLRSRYVFALALALLVVAVAGIVPHAAADDANRRELRDAHSVAEMPSVGERVARIARTAVGVPYHWGGESPTSGFDCSGLVRWAYGRIGIDLPHSSYALHDVGRQVSTASMEPGDVLFFEGLGHVGLYVGGGQMVHAPQSGRDVEVVRLASSNYGRRLVGARRVASG